ncbi:Nif3-like dinuclear metal center hexameric protein [Larkinella terrae]|uniref:NGG1p interacting factor NIF3 n=1 Tax=Larkinella terrae TaxID=2025311 RepID=A0A7K0ELQ2_9BACT|nr:Nif3-like dinuclear metal center hexameric protein [Larkinella terrae]MRS62790.1 NGG1p interacting factor NIF3 [Larkinella terrae]
MIKPEKPGRREFVETITKATILLSVPGVSSAERFWPAAQPVTVGQVMELILKTIPNAPFPKTVDTLKSGSPDQKVTGIISTMFATMDVIEKAIQQKANFIIVHEPTFYNHLDETDWLAKDDVFRKKHDLLEKNGIAVWRFHDYWHSHRPDGIRMGVVTALGWEKYMDANNPRLITLPAPQALKQIITHAKTSLGIATMRVVGDLNQSCQRISLMPGASGGRSHILAMGQDKPDLLLCGEISEWETAEYVRDARQQGQKLSLGVLGHIMSEAPGMQWLVPWLQPKLPEVKISYIDSKTPFTYV